MPTGLAIERERDAETGRDGERERGSTPGTLGLHPLDRVSLPPPAAPDDESGEDGPQSPGDVRRDQRHQGRHEQSTDEGWSGPGGAPTGRAGTKVEDGRPGGVTEEGDGGLYLVV